MRAERLELSTQGLKVLRASTNSQGETNHYSGIHSNHLEMEPLTNDQAPIDSRLKLVVDRWPTLSEADRIRVAKIAGGAI